MKPFLTLHYMHVKMKAHSSKQEYLKKASTKLSCGKKTSDFFLKKRSFRFFDLKFSNYFYIRTLGVKIRNLKVNFKTGDNWRQVGQ